VGKAVKNPIWLLSGFLGDENHWGDFPGFFARHFGTRPLWMNWFKETRGAKSLEEAAQFLAQRAYAEGLRPVLIGYSMGARLALQCAITAPGAFSGVCALSAHPGLKLETEIQRRRDEDRGWSDLLLSDPNLFWRRWNERDALKNSHQPPPPHWQDASQWSQVLVQLGTAEQSFFPDELLSPRLPVTVVSGERDTKFTHLMQSFPSTVEKIIVPNAGHRLPLEAPEELARLLVTPVKKTQEII